MNKWSSPNNQIQGTGLKQWFSKDVYLAHRLYAAADLPRYVAKKCR
jgi:hypothetical protein